MAGRKDTERSVVLHYRDNVPYVSVKTAIYLLGPQLSFKEARDFLEGRGVLKGAVPQVEGTPYRKNIHCMIPLADIADELRTFLPKNLKRIPNYR